MAQIVEEPKVANVLPLSLLKRIMIAPCPEGTRVSKDAVLEMDAIVCGIITEYSLKAQAIAENGKRKTIGPSDVQLAFD